MTSRILFPVLLLLALPARPAQAQAQEAAYQRFQARYDGASPREWSGLAGFCHEESERFLMLVSPQGGMVYFILPQHREWRTGDYSVDDLMRADPEMGDPDVLYAVLMGIDPRERNPDGVLYDTNVTSGTVHLDRASDTHVTGTLRLGVRVRVSDPAGPSRTEQATLRASFNAYPMRRCPEVLTGG